MRHAVIAAAQSLLNVRSCRLCLGPLDEEPAICLAEELAPEWQLWSAGPAAEAMRAQARMEGVCSSTLLEDAPPSSVAVAALSARGRFLGTLEVFAADAKADSAETRMLLGYLASEAGVALDHAALYHEVEEQGMQLRGYVEKHHHQRRAGQSALGV